MVDFLIILLLVLNSLSIYLDIRILNEACGVLIYIALIYTFFKVKNSQ